MSRILFVRTVPYKLDFSKYNVQALGLGKELVDNGHNFDFLYFPYLKRKNREEIIYKHDSNELKIIQHKGIRFFRTGFSYKTLSKKFLNQYDLIICCEYNQLMSYLISKRHKNTVIYSGPYYNLFMIPALSTLYDKIFVKKINKNVKKIYVKSELAREYLENKGYTNIETIGVGLDISKYNDVKKISDETKDILVYLNNNNNVLLYVGALSKRKNFPFLLKVYNEVFQKEKNIKLLIIGKGNKKYVSEILDNFDKEVLENIKIVPSLSNEQLSYIYPKATLFLLPSINEIFGMVLLESMYFNTPVISSKNGGSTTVIKNNYNGFVINEFDEKKWANTIIDNIKDKRKLLELGRNANHTVVNKYLWKNIYKKLLNGDDSFD